MKIQVVAHCNSKNPRIEKQQEVLHIYLKVKPENNRANMELLELVAGYFHKPKNLVKLALGRRNKNKVFEIF